MWLALASLGAIPAYINYNLSGEHLIHCVKTSLSKLLIVDEEVSNKLVGSVAAIKEMGIDIVTLNRSRLDMINSLSPFRSDFDPGMNKQTTVSCICFTRSVKLSDGIDLDSGESLSW